MYLTKAPGPIVALNPSAHSKVTAIQSGSKGRVTDVLEEVADNYVVGLVEKIPYYSNGIAKTRFLEALPTVNYKTLLKICEMLRTQPKEYWYDNRSRNFSGIEDAIEARFEALGYTVTETEIRHYIGSETMKRIYIPTKTEKK